MNWQPMETAPKNGAAILACYTGHGNVGFVIVRWDDDKYAKKPRPYWTSYSSKYEDRNRNLLYWCPLIPPTQLQTGV